MDNIKIIFEGIDKIEKDEEENLLISSKGNTLQMLKPKVYQNIKDKKIDIESSFIIEEDTVKFHIPKYNKSETLVIDPQLLYGSYIGGNDYDYGNGIAVDKFQNAYITGYTYSTDFPLKNAYQNNLNGYVDVFLVKIDTKLKGESSLKYGSYIGGNDYEEGRGIAVDNFQNAYITGCTNSTDFPLKNPYQNNLKGDSDAFLAKLSTKPSCSDLLLNQSLCYPIYDWSFQSKGEVWYKIKITNKGPDTDTNLIMTDFIDKNMEILSTHSAVGTIEQRENTAYWQIDTLEVGQTVECKIKVKSKTPMISKYVKNIASVKSDNIAANLKNTIDSIIVYIRTF